MKYEDLSEKQKVYICNGCGAKGGLIVPPKAIFFNASCDHHDYGHWKGCTESDRQRDNKTLRSAMVTDVKRLPWYKRPFYYPWAWIYFIGLELVSWKFFYYGDKKRKVENYNWEKIFALYSPDELIPWDECYK